MTTLSERTSDDLRAFLDSAEARLSSATANKLALDLTRGKPSASQTALSNALEEQIAGNYVASDGTDTRNYGGLRGIPEARALGALLTGAPSANVLAAGNSSLSLMHLVVDTAMRFGLHADLAPWQDTPGAAILTPVPGYDRHFALTQALGIDMINVPLTEHGPDMQAVLEAVKDERVKGIWCVPKYSNPTGCVYSTETVQALAELPAKAAADNFVVLWDNAYAVHDFDPPGETLANLTDAATAAGTLAHTAQFASTSKITFAGAGVAFVASAEPVLAQLEKMLATATIGFDKVNQLRHARFLNNRLTEHMRAHAALLKPKFDLVQNKLEAGLGGLGIAQWTNPLGGYFVSLDVLPGLASEIVAMARGVGLSLTAAGATFPYGRDPNNCNIRIAPTFADLDSLEAAMEVLVLCVQIASAKKLLEETCS